MRKNISVGVLALLLVLYPAIGKASNIFEITLPNNISKTYIEYVDYAPFTFSAFDDVTATLEFVGNLGLGYPSDFAGFTTGNIALIERGTLTFHDKVFNAESAGAVGAIVYNNVAGLNYGTLSSADTNIPSISTSDTVGAELIQFIIDYNQITIHLRIDTPFNNPVPEPTTILLLGFGLIGLAGARRKFQK